MDDPIKTTERLQTLLDRLEDARGRLAAAEDSEQAVEVLQDLVQLAKEVQTEIERQRSEAPSARELQDPP